MLQPCMWSRVHPPSPRPARAPGPSPHHALHAVEHNAIVSNPLSLASADELVDDALGCVVKVAKLSLPEDKGVGLAMV